MTQAQDNAALAATRADTYVPIACHAVVREAVEMIVTGDTELALWSLVWHTDHLAKLSDSTITLADAWDDYTAEVDRQVNLWGTRALQRTQEGA